MHLLIFLVMKLTLGAIQCLVLLTFWSCHQGSGRQPLAGLLLDSYEHDHWKTDSSLLAKEFADAGTELLVRVSEGDAALQLKQAHELIAAGVSVLVVMAVDQNKASAIVDICKQYGVTIIAYDRLINKCDLDYYVSYNHVAIGRQQAEFVIENVARPELCIIGGSIHDHNAFMIQAGQSGVLDQYFASGKLIIHGNVFTEHWSEEEGFSLAYSLLKKFPDINTVLAANDAIAGGVARAAQELGHRKLVITGMGADSSALQRIARGEQTMTIYKPQSQLAMITANLANDVCNKDSVEISQREYSAVNNGFKDVRSLLVSSLIIDSSNVSVMLAN